MRYVEKMVTAGVVGFSLVGLSLTGVCTAAGQEFVIHSFSPGYVGGGGSSGPTLGSDLTMDAAGDLFGTTAEDGRYEFGTVFEISPVAGGWTEKVLHDFTPTEGGGSGPLLMDAKGNMYGVSGIGVFQLSSAPGGWTYTTISEFLPYTFPNGGLVFDAHGNIFGTTANGGANGHSSYQEGDGTVFELTPSGSGTWTEKVVYSFGATSTDAAYPDSGLVIDSSGNLYGVTSGGASSGVGAVFEVTFQSDGDWTDKVLHSFQSSDPSDGYYPRYNLILDAKGNLYGTTVFGGIGNNGTVFELSPAQTGAWTEKLFSFQDIATGETPDSGLTMDAKGNLYGTTATGGIYSTADYNGGVVFELVCQPGGEWTEKVLHSFPASVFDGSTPSGVILDSKGNLYGTTLYGGIYGYGTVYEIATDATPVETTITLVVDPSTNLVAGSPLTLTAHVVPATGPAVPGGTVIFADPAFPGRSVTAHLIDGVATYRGTFPPTGSYSLQASYSGAPGFDASDSAVLTGTVTAPLAQ